MNPFRLVLLGSLLTVGCSSESTTGDAGNLEFSLAYDCQSFIGRSCAPQRSLEHAVLVESSAYLLVTGGDAAASATVDSSTEDVATCLLAKVDDADWDWQGGCQAHGVGTTILTVRAGSLSDTVTLRVANAADIEGRFESTHTAANDTREGVIDWGGGLTVAVAESLKVSFWPTDADGEDLVSADQPVACEVVGTAVAISPADCQRSEQRHFDVVGRAPGAATVEFSLGEVSRTLAVTVP